MSRKWRHIGYADEVQPARVDGGAVRVLCGRTLRPLAQSVLDELPTCPVCATKRDLSYSAHTISRFSQWAWSEGDVA